MSLTRKIRIKITFPTVLLLALLVVMAVISGIYLSKMQHMNHDLTERFREINEVAEIEHNVWIIRDLFSEHGTHVTELTAEYYRHETNILNFINNLEHEFSVVNGDELQSLSYIRQTMEEISLGAKAAFSQSPADYKSLHALSDQHIPELLNHLSNWHDEEMEIVEGINTNSENTLSNYIFTMYVLGSLVLLTISFSLVFYHHVLTRRILSISNGTHQLGDGNLLYKIDIKGDDELATMAHDINVMAKKIHEYQLQLQRIARTDALTATYNRHALDDMLRHELARAQRADSHATALLVDVDFFKKVNDTYGHEAGDKALIHIAGILRQQCRTGDYVFRLGGEEFLIYLCDCNSDYALSTADRFRIAIEKSNFVYSDKQLHITVSIGIASSREIYDIRELTKMADVALYQAKANGRNCCQVYQSDNIVPVKKKAS